MDSRVDLLRMKLIQSLFSALRLSVDLHRWRLAQAPRGLPFASVLLTGVALLMTGCAETVEVRRYSVPKPPHRMLAAMIKVEKEAWFFKVTGPRQELGGLEPKFDEFLKSVRMDASATPPKLEWDVPDGWKQLPGNTDRFATLEIPQGEKPLELTITRLPVPDGDWDQYRLQNINRWRGQIRLGPLTLSQLRDEVVELSGAAGKPISRVNLVGTLSPARRPAMGGMPGMAGMGGGFGSGELGGGGAMADDSASGAGVPFDYAAPDEWKAGARRPFVRLSYRVEGQGSQAEVTVSSLVAASNDLLSNVNRWRTQLQLPEFSEAELAKAVQSIDLGGVQGAYVELVGEDPGRETILGVMAVHGEDAWFFKFKGPGAVAEREKARFESFVKSVRFKG